jgi:hypothetical protein
MLGGQQRPFPRGCLGRVGRITDERRFGTFECGPVEDCLDVGHPTHGVCDPYA